MTFRELVVAYFQYYAIQVYLLLGVLTAIGAIWTMESLLPLAAAAVAAVLVYPLVWYLLHRFILHGRFLFRSPLTARLWKRIHFDHHQDPHNLEVLFGALYTTLPTIIAVTGPIGWWIGELPGALAGTAAGLFTTCVYEFCHCVQHLSYKPKSKFLRRIKRLHMAHHFHNEQGNFGITNYWWDRLFGSFYETTDDVPYSDTVFNLGYTEAEAERFPWVARLSETPLDITPRERRQQLIS